MPARRSGSPTSFWDAASVGVGGLSNVVELSRDTEQVAFFITVAGATTITVEVAHSGALNTDGTANDTNASDWGQLVYINVPVQYVFSGAGSISVLVPDFEPGFVRLKSSAATTITAGHEATGE